MQPSTQTALRKESRVSDTMADIVKHYVNNVSTQRSQDEETGIFIQFAPINDLDANLVEREDEPSL